MINRAKLHNETRTRLQTDEQEMLRWLPARQESRNFANGAHCPHSPGQHR